ncbi:Crp/Fnr family transcriptional regulator [Paenibacillus lignilyticus]|uniref:Crp/Fnr family transcriptional regulator n=1 Tax=Paenibacillus lignilyticus TaxID=1172615 RepID=A0ABS5CGW4_9BACL|nr:Crp/Fnr family transcriptional regulator [Paenibacillus lignilyticus]MBP3965060.1 Crp/Fnr family transcriptional regulator [Paenibacillus lignilyticus]
MNRIENPRLSLLSQIKIFESLPVEIIHEIDQLTKGANVNTLPKNSIIQTPDNQRNGLFFVITGKLRLYKTNSAGKQYTVCILSEGGMFGEVESFSLGTSGTYVETMEETMIYSIPSEQFEPLLSKYSELTLRFLSEMSTRLRDQDELVEKLVFRDLRGKVLYFLNRLSKKFSVEENGYRKIDIPLTHQELANMIGATREAVSLVLQELSNEGILATSRRTVMIDIEKAMEELS